MVDYIGTTKLSVLGPLDINLAVLGMQSRLRAAVVGISLRKPFLIYLMRNNKRQIRQGFGPELENPLSGEMPGSPPRERRIVNANDTIKK